MFVLRRPGAAYEDADAPWLAVEQPLPVAEGDPLCLRGGAHATLSRADWKMLLHCCVGDVLHAAQAHGTISVEAVLGRRNSLCALRFSSTPQGAEALRRAAEDQPFFPGSAALCMLVARRRGALRFAPSAGCSCPWPSDAPRTRRGLHRHQKLALAWASDLEMRAASDSFAVDCNYSLPWADGQAYITLPADSGGAVLLRHAPPPDMRRARGAVLADPPRSGKVATMVRLMQQGHAGGSNAAGALDSLGRAACAAARAELAPARGTCVVMPRCKLETWRQQLLADWPTVSVLELALIGQLRRADVPAMLAADVVLVSSELLDSVPYQRHAAAVVEGAANFQHQGTMGAVQWDPTVLRTAAAALHAGGALPCSAVLELVAWPRLIVHAPQPPPCASRLCAGFVWLVTSAPMEPEYYARWVLPTVAHGHPGAAEAVSRELMWRWRPPIDLGSARLYDAPLTAEEYACVTQQGACPVAVATSGPPPGDDPQPSDPVTIASAARRYVGRTRTSMLRAAQRRADRALTALPVWPALDDEARRLRLIASDLDSQLQFLETTLAAEPQTCPICEQAAGDVVPLCGHALCGECHARLPEPQCPICRRNHSQLWRRVAAGAAPRVAPGSRTRALHDVARCAPRCVIVCSAASVQRAVADALSGVCAIERFCGTFGCRGAIIRRTNAGTVAEPRAVVIAVDQVGAVSSLRPTDVVLYDSGRSTSGKAAVAIGAAIAALARQGGEEAPATVHVLRGNGGPTQPSVLDMWAAEVEWANAQAKQAEEAAADEPSVP